VKSLGEILERGLYHAALAQTFRLRNAVESRESEASPRARAGREALAQTLTVVLTANALDAIAYPTMTRRPSLLGEPQAGGTCRMSAHSGLPAITHARHHHVDLVLDHAALLAAHVLLLDPRAADVPERLGSPGQALLDRVLEVLRGGRTDQFPPLSRFMPSIIGCHP
jgi:hypothetical protein